MNILVTGAAGFLGSHVVDALLAADHEVLGVDDLSTGRREWCVAPCITADFSVASLHDVDAIVHCAAVADISQNWAKNHNRDAIYASNIDSLIVLLERLTPRVKRFVFVSSAAVTAPQVSPYTASKRAGEALCQAYCLALDIPLTIVRPVSMLGPRYSHGHIADFVRMAARDGVIRAKDNGFAKRPYAHVHNVAKAITDAISDPVALVNCLGNAWTVRQTADLMGCPVEWPAGYHGWKADPDVSGYIVQEKMPVTIAHWVVETIDWCREHIT